MEQDEEWRPAPISGYAPLYEVSSFGRVRSVRRKGGNNRWYGGKVLRPSPDSGDYPYVNLCSTEGRGQVRCRVHMLVALSFLGSKPDWAECVRHLDGNTENNRVGNLKWGTDEENMRDMVRHGRSHWANKETCKEGHDLVQGSTQRYCPVCKPIHDHDSYLRRKEAANA